MRSKMDMLMAKLIKYDMLKDHLDPENEYDLVVATEIFKVQEKIKEEYMRLMELYEKQKPQLTLIIGGKS